MRSLQIPLGNSMATQRGDWIQYYGPVYAIGLRFVTHGGFPLYGRRFNRNDKRSVIR
ncbi:hypothetical protein C8R44DRAFT_763981, partial [Mycena epipterygia]